jgi:hypothetical protein
MGALKFEITGTCESLKNALRDAQTAFHTTADAAEQQGQRIDTLLGKLKETAAMIGVGFGVKEFGRKVMEVRGQFQQLEMAFNTMLRSESKANDLMNQLVRTAATTPFDLQSVAEGAKQLLAYGTSAEEVNGTLVRLGDIAAGVSIPLNDLVWLYGTTMTQGRMFTQDLRQFQGRGIPIAEEIAKIKGVAVDAVGDLVTAGKVTSDVVKQAIEGMTAEGSKFGGLMEAQSHTITGQISNIEDTIDMMFNSIGQKSEGVINTTLSGVSYVIDHWEQVGKVILAVATAFGTYKAALLAVIAAQKIVAMAKTAEAFISLAKGITTAKDAMLLFNIATKANPLGLILGIIASAASAFALFGDSTDEATEKQEKFGESADKAAEKAESLFAILQSASSTSKVHKDALNELKGIADEYGITLSKEGDLTQQLIEKKEALIGVIREEAIERQRANDITEASDTYQKNIQELKDQIKESLSDDFSDMQKNQLVNLISEEDIKKITEAYKAMINAQKKSVELTGSWNSRFSAEQIGTYNKTISDLAEKVGVYSKALGVSERSANDAKRAIQNNGMALATTRKEYDDTVNATNKAAAAAQSAEMATDGLTESQRSLSDKTRMAKENVNDLANEIKKMIETYNNSNINIQISYEELNTPPAWMQGVAQKMSSDQLKNLASMHQSRANRMRSHKAQTGRDLVMKNQQGYYTNEREEQVMAGQYAILAQQKKTEEENARRAAEEAKKKKTKSTTKKVDKKQLEQQQKDYAALIKKNEQERKRKAEDLAFSTTEAEIAAMKDGTDKTITQINLDFKKKEAEINRSYEDLKQQKIDKAKELWKANPKNKDKVFDDKAVDTSYSKAETDYYNAQLKANQEEHDRALAEEFAKEHQALNDYLKEYGSIQQQKLAITQEYADKIAKAENAYQKASLANQRDNELKKIDASDVFEQIDWENVFADLSSHTKEYLVSLRAQLQSLLKSGKLTDVSDISKVQEKINDINAEISKQGGIFDFIGTKQQENIRRINEAKEAQEALNSAKLQEADIEKQYEKALKQANHKAADLGVRAIGDDTTGIQANIDKASIDKSTKEYKEMSSILTNLAVLEGKLAKAREKTAKATIEAKDKEDAAKKSTKAQIADWFSDAQEFISKSGIDQLPELFSSLGMDEASAKIGQGLSALNDSAGAVADFESGNYIGALTKGISALQGFSNVLGIGADNTAKMQDKIDELNQKNDVLASCLEELNDTLQGTNSITGAQEVYKDAVELINAQKKNASDAMKAEANKHGTWRSSLHSSVNDNKTWKKDMEKVSKILGKTVKSSKDFLSLSPEEMKKIRDTDKDLFMSILNEYRKEGGKGGRSDKLPSMIQDYIDKYADAVNDLNEQMSEKYTQMSFDDMKSSFFDALMDMDKDAEDFSDDFSKYLMKSVLNAKIGDLLDKDLKEFYDEWSKLAEDGLSETEIDYLTNKWNGIVDKGIKFRDESAKITGYTGSSSQTATSGGWQSMGQETAEELNGRFTALQIAGEQAKVNTDLIVSAVNTLVAKTDANFTAVSEVRNMMIMTNSYLEDIRKYNKLTYEEFGSKLDDIKRSLKNL